MRGYAGVVLKYVEKVPGWLINGEKPPYVARKAVCQGRSGVAALLLGNNTTQRRADLYSRKADVALLPQTV